MVVLDINIDGQLMEFEIKDVAPIALNDMIRRARFNKSVFLSLIIIRPKLSAHEWYANVPSEISNKFYERIIEFEENGYV